MRTIPRSWIGLMSWFALQVFFQIVPYDSGVVGPYTIPRNEGLAMDAYNSQAQVGRTSSVRPAGAYLLFGSMRMGLSTNPLSAGL